MFSYKKSSSERTNASKFIVGLENHDNELESLDIKRWKSCTCKWSEGVGGDNVGKVNGLGSVEDISVSVVEGIADCGVGEVEWFQTDTKSNIC